MNRATVMVALLVSAHPTPKSPGLNEHITMPLEQGCVYEAVVRGDLPPAAASERKPHADPRAEPISVVTAKIDVRASVRCPRSSVLHSRDSFVAMAPLSREQLEQTLERRGIVVSTVGTQRCVYVPDFAFDGTHLEGRGVSYLCPVQPAR